MTTRAQKIRIGVFATIASCLAGVVIAVWGGLHLFTHRDHYVILFQGSVLGLADGADVFYNGIPVGTVTSLAPARDDISRVRVEIAVDQGTPVRVDTKAKLSISGITGSKSIDLQAGAADAPPALPGGPLAVGETTIDRLERALDSMTARSQELVERANRIEANAETVVANLAQITDPKALGDILAQSRVVVGELAKASASVHQLIDAERAPLHHSLESVEDSANEIARAVRDDGGQLRAALADLRQASRSFKELAREVRDQPSRLLVSNPKSDRKLP